MRFRTAAMAAAFVLAAICSEIIWGKTPVAADSDGIYSLVMDRVLRSKVGAAYGGAQSDSSVGRQNPYRARPTQKALVACINWSNSSSNYLDIQDWNSVYNHRALITARDEALTVCRSKGVKTCECQIVDENDTNVLQIPPAYLEKFGAVSSNQSLGPAQITQPIQLRYKAAPPVSYTYSVALLNGDKEVIPTLRVKGSYEISESSSALIGTVLLKEISAGEKIKPLDISISSGITPYGEQKQSSFSIAGERDSEFDGFAREIFSLAIPKWPPFGLKSERDKASDVPLPSVLSSENAKFLEAFQEILFDVDVEVIGRGVFNGKDVILMTVRWRGKEKDAAIQCDSDIKIDVATSGLASLVRKCLFEKEELKKS